MPDVPFLEGEESSLGAGCGDSSIVETRSIGLDGLADTSGGESTGKPEFCGSEVAVTTVGSVAVVDKVGDVGDI